MTAPGRRDDLRHRSVAVVGGGVTGLTAARRLARRGAAVTLFEAGCRLGGQVRTEEVAGHRVDVGAEALHLGSPGLAALVDDLGLAGALVAARPGTPWLWNGHGLRRLPAGVGPAGPTRLGPVVGSGVLSPAGVVRAAAEPLVRRSAAQREGRDMAVAAFVAGRFGRQVADRLVDPVLGSLHAGDVAKLSLQAATPQLAAEADRHRSLLLARRRRRRAAPPAFASFRSGLATFTGALLAGTGVAVRLGTPVTSLDRVGDRYRLVLGSGSGAERSAGHEAVVLAVPCDAAAALLRPAAAGAAAALSGMRRASVATVVAAYPRAGAAPALRGTGLLVTSSAGRLLKAATFLSAKWAHLDGTDHTLVRMSAGRAGSPAVDRLGDGALVDRLHADLADATGLGVEPVETLVTRWPQAMTQLEVGHLGRVADVRRGLGDLPGLVLAGASYEGLGIGACVASGERAAAAVAARLEGDGPEGSR